MKVKKLRICLEVNGLAEDENGKPCLGGICLTLGEDCDEEIIGEEYQRIVGGVDVVSVLKYMGLDKVFSKEDCRLITPEEYDRNYGEED